MGLVQGREQSDAALTSDNPEVSNNAQCACACMVGLSTKEMWSLVERHRNLDFQLDPADCLRLLGVKEACGPTCPAASSESIMGIDSLQLVGAACCFSATSRKARLAALFDVFDFRKRGSLTFDETFLLLDTCSAGIDRFGGGRFTLPNTAELELVVDILFGATPHDRLSRKAFINNTCLRVRSWLQLFDGLIDHGGEAMPFCSTRPLWAQPSMERSELTLGKVKSACGATNAFFMMDGRLVRTMGPLLISSSVQATQRQGREENRIGWCHEKDIFTSAYSWEHNLIATACAQKIVIWGYPQIHPLATIAVREVVALCWALGRLDLCVADKYGNVQVFIFAEGSSASPLFSHLNDDGSIASSIDESSKSDSEDSSSLESESEQEQDDLERGHAAKESCKLKADFLLSKRRGVFTLPAGSIRTVCYIEDDRILVGGIAGLAEVIDVSANEQRRVGFSVRPDTDFLCCAYHPRSKFAVLGGNDGLLYVLEGYRVTRSEATFQGEPLHAIHVCTRGFTTSSSKNGYLKLWSFNVQLIAEFDEMTRAPSLDTGARMVCWSFDGSRIAITTRACEVFLVHGVSGHVVGEGGVSSGHLDMRVHYWISTTKLVSVGQDWTLRLWDMKKLGFLESTCMLDERIPLCLTARELTQPQRVIVCAIGFADGFSVVERNDATKTWTEKYVYSEPGFTVQALKLSPCGSYLFVQDRIYDLKHGEEFCRLPESVPNLDSVDPRFIQAGKSETKWHLYLGNDHVFAVQEKSVFHKQGLRRIKLPKQTEVSDMGGDPETVPYLESLPSLGWFYTLEESNPLMQMVEKVYDCALRIEDAAPKLHFLEKNPEVIKNEKDVIRTRGEGQSKKSADEELDKLMEDDEDKTEESLAQEYAHLKPGPIIYKRSVQGCKGPSGDSIASLGSQGLLAYAASDMIVLAKSRNYHVRYLQMLAQVVSLRSCPCSAPGLWWLAACDTMRAMVWQISEDGSDCKVCFFVRLEGVSQIDINPSGLITAVCARNMATTWRLEKPQLSNEELDFRHGPTPLARFPLIAQKSTISTLKAHGSCNVSLAELDKETGLLWIHHAHGREYERVAIEHSCKVTCIWGDWCGDQKGSLWRLDSDEARLILIEAKAHDGVGVKLLRDFVSVSEKSVIRVWSAQGDLKHIFDNFKVRIDSICRRGLVGDGHRVLKLLKESEQVASAHTKVRVVCFGRNNLWATIGEQDTTVCLWDSDFQLINEIRLDDRPDAVCTCVSFSHDGDVLAIGTNMGSVSVRSIESKLEDELVRLRCGDGSPPSSIQCLAFSPSKTGSDSYRFVVARADGVMSFYDSRYAQVRQSLTPSGIQWRWPPDTVQFADDCEIVRLLDQNKRECYADSVSANPIPEERLEKTWITAEPVDEVQVHLSVLKHSFMDLKLDETITFGTSLVENARREGRKAVLGITHNVPRQFNARGELIRVGGDCATGMDMNLLSQRCIGTVCPGTIVACNFSSDASKIAIVSQKPSLAVVFDTVSGEPCGPPHALQNTLAIESMAVSVRGDLAIVGRKLDHLMEEDGKINESDTQEEEVVEKGSLVVVFVGALSGMQLEHQVLADLSKRVQDEDAPSRRTGCTFVDRYSFMCIGVCPSNMHLPIFGVHEGTLRCAQLEAFDAEITCVAPGLLGDAQGQVLFLQGQNFGKVHPVLAHPGATISALSNQASTEIWASGDSIGRVRVWKDRMCLAELRMDASSKYLAVDIEGVRVVNDSHEFIVEDPERRRELSFLGHTKSCVSATLSTCGQFAYTASRDLTLRRWDVKTATVVSTANLDNLITSMAQSGDRLYLITEDNLLQALDAVHLDLLHEIKLPRPNLREVARVNDNYGVMTLIDRDAKQTFILHTDSFKTAGPYPFSAQGPAQDYGTARVLLRGSVCIVFEGTD